LRKSGILGNNFETIVAREIIIYFVVHCKKKKKKSLIK